MPSVLAQAAQESDLVAVVRPAPDGLLRTCLVRQPELTNWPPGRHKPRDGSGAFRSPACFASRPTWGLPTASCLMDTYPWTRGGRLQGAANTVGPGASCARRLRRLLRFDRGHRRAYPTFPAVAHRCAGSLHQAARFWAGPRVVEGLGRTRCRAHGRDSARSYLGHEPVRLSPRPPGREARAYAYHPPA